MSEFLEDLREESDIIIDSDSVDSDTVDDIDIISASEVIEPIDKTKIYTINRAS